MTENQARIQCGAPWIVNFIYISKNYGLLYLYVTILGGVYKPWPNMTVAGCGILHQLANGQNPIVIQLFTVSYSSQ